MFEIVPGIRNKKPVLVPYAAVAVLEFGKKKIFLCLLCSNIIALNASCQSQQQVKRLSRKRENDKLPKCKTNFFSADKIKSPKDFDGAKASFAKFADNFGLLKRPLSCLALISVMDL